MDILKSKIRWLKEKGYKSFYALPEHERIKLELLYLRLQKPISLREKDYQRLIEIIEGLYEVYSGSRKINKKELAQLILKNLRIVEGEVEKLFE